MTKEWDKPLSSFHYRSWPWLSVRWNNAAVSLPAVQWQFVHFTPRSQHPQGIQFKQYVHPKLLGRCWQCLGWPLCCYAACSAVLCCSTQKRSIIKLWVQVHESTCCCINKLSSGIEEFMPDFTGTNKTDGRQISEQCSTCFMFHVSIHSSAIHVCDDLMKAQLLLVWNCFHGRLALQQKKHNRWLPRAAKY